MLINNFFLTIYTLTPYLHVTRTEALIAVSPPTQRVHKTSLKRRISHSLRSIQEIGIGKSETGLSDVTMTSQPSNTIRGSLYVDRFRTDRELIS